MSDSIVITGMGTVTPLGHSPGEILQACFGGRVAVGVPAPEPLSHVRVARIEDFDPARWVAEAKMIRMMSRDAQLAVAAAQLAMRDAGIGVGETYGAHEVGIFGATGLAGIPLEEVSKLIRTSAAADGSLDLLRFGSVALRQVRPVLSFKILANMPICFVSIALGVQGPNAIYNGWEIQGAHAIQAGMQAIRLGRARAVLVGGTDVKTHELGLIALKQQGALGEGASLVGEGAAFLVLEEEREARRRGAPIYARIRPKGDGFAGRHVWGSSSGSGEGIYPKRHTGDLFAAAAGLQVACAAKWCREIGGKVRAHCEGHGGPSVCFDLEAA